MAKNESTGLNRIRYFLHLVNFKNGWTNKPRLTLGDQANVIYFRLPLSLQKAIQHTMSY